MLLDKQRIKSMKKNLGLPNTTKFCGFVIHIPECDEFIAKIHESKLSKVIGYSSTPDYAIKFNCYEKALKASNKCEKYNTVIGFLFDFSGQYFVGFDNISI